VKGKKKAKIEPEYHSQPARNNTRTPKEKTTKVNLQRKKRSHEGWLGEGKQGFEGGQNEGQGTELKEHNTLPDKTG